MKPTPRPGTRPSAFDRRPSKRLKADAPRAGSPLRHRFVRRRRDDEPPRLTTAASTVLFIGAIVALVLAMPLYDLIDEVHERYQLEGELAREKATKRELSAQLERWSHESYVSAQARERLGYVRPGETRYRVVDPGPSYGEDEGGGDESSDRPWFLMIVDSAASADEAQAQTKGAETTRKGMPAQGATPVPSKEHH